MTGRRAIGGLFRKLAEREGSSPVDHEPVGCLAFLGIDVPPVRGRAHQHRPRGRCGFAQRLLKARTDVEPAVIRDLRSRPALFLASALA